MCEHRKRSSEALHKLSVHSGRQDRRVIAELLSTAFIEDSAVMADAQRRGICHVKHRGTDNSELSTRLIEDFGRTRPLLQANYQAI